MLFSKKKRTKTCLSWNYKPTSDVKNKANDRSLKHNQTTTKKSQNLEFYFCKQIKTQTKNRCKQVDPKARRCKQIWLDFGN